MSLFKQVITGGLVIGLFSVASIRPVAAQAAPEQPAAPELLVERVSAADSDGGGGEYAAISANGQHVVFESHSSGLVPGHIDDSLDVFLFDRQAAAYERVSTRSDGSPVYNPGDYTAPPAISGDGRYVAFTSRSEHLVDNDNNLMPDVFVHDRETGETELISVATNGQGGNDYSSTTAISADGRYVVFQSWADNLIKEDTNESVDIFIRDRQLGVTEIVSITDSEQQGTDDHMYGFSSVAVSDDGRYVAFSYDNLEAAGFPGIPQAGIYLRDRQERTTRWIAAGEYPALSADGSTLAFVSASALTGEDRNGSSDVYVVSLASRQFERVSLSSGGSEVREQWIYSAPDLSADGRYVVFESSAPGLVPDDDNGLSDIFLRDRDQKTTTLVSRGLSGAAADGESHQPAISDDGSAIAFTSSAADIASGDDNGNVDVFVYNRLEFTVAPLALYIPIISR